jgi:prophage maintenance system killer protein
VREPVGKKTIHHMDFDTLLQVNKGVASLTGEPYEYSKADGRKLVSLIKEVEQRANNQDFDEAVAEKAALLVFKVASGQYFRSGNKRTALVAGFVFLVKNGYTMDLENAEFVTTVDKAGMAAADLDDLYGVMKELVTKTKSDRKGWEGVVKGTVEKHKEFLTRLAS